VGVAKLMSLSQPGLESGRHSSGVFLPAAGIRDDNISIDSGDLASVEKTGPRHENVNRKNRVVLPLSSRAASPRALGERWPHDLLMAVFFVVCRHGLPGLDRALGTTFRIAVPSAIGSVNGIPTRTTSAPDWPGISRRIASEVSLSWFAVRSGTSQCARPCALISGGAAMRCSSSWALRRGSTGPCDPLRLRGA